MIWCNPNISMQKTKVCPWKVAILQFSSWNKNPIGKKKEQLLLLLHPQFWPLNVSNEKFHPRFATRAAFCTSITQFRFLAQNCISLVTNRWRWKKLKKNWMRLCFAFAGSYFKKIHPHKMQNEPANFHQKRAWGRPLIFSFSVALK